MTMPTMKSFELHPHIGKDGCLRVSVNMPDGRRLNARDSLPPHLEKAFGFLLSQIVIHCSDDHDSALDALNEICPGLGRPDAR